MLITPSASLIYFPMDYKALQKECEELHQQLQEEREREQQLEKTRYEIMKNKIPQMRRSLTECRENIRRIEASLASEIPPKPNTESPVTRQERESTSPTRENRTATPEAQQCDFPDFDIEQNKRIAETQKQPYRREPVLKLKKLDQTSAKKEDDEQITERRKKSGTKVQQVPAAKAPRPEAEDPGTSSGAAESVKRPVIRENRRVSLDIKLEKRPPAEQMQGLEAGDADGRQGFLTRPTDIQEGQGDSDRREERPGEPDRLRKDPEDQDRSEQQSEGLERFLAQLEGPGLSPPPRDEPSRGQQDTAEPDISRRDSGDAN
ncbi:hypothetical protein EAI_06339 [Harpegnathos saltator]|uniref:Uncharacterized protein n=1 Tax=Harpegnathos saltator TaxID=610380 RepID=E2C908_HARSA|nr:hypothetical protein EAI_06339 [Harpegnathos saltator]